MSRKPGPDKKFEHRTTMRFDPETIQNLDWLKNFLSLDSRSAVVRWMAKKFVTELKLHLPGRMSLGGENKP